MRMTHTKLPDNTASSAQRILTPVVWSCVVLAGLSVVHPIPVCAEDPMQMARLSLERARSRQGEVVKAMNEIMAGRQRSAATVELVNTLSQVYRMQLAVLQRTQGVVLSTWGKSAESLSEQDRQTIEQLAIDQRSVRQRLSDWTVAFAKFATSPEASEGIRRLQTKASESQAGGLMEQASDLVTTNHPAQAADIEQQVADALARLIQMLEVLTTDPDQLRDKRIRELRDIAEKEKGILASLTGASSALKLKELRQKQDEAIGRARLMTFEETGIPPNALERVRASLASMQSARSALRQNKPEDARRAMETAVAILTQAIELLQASAAGADPDLPRIPLGDGNGQRSIAGATMAGAGVPMPDMNALAQLAADISLLTKICRAQTQLTAETFGRVPPMPDPAGRQLSLSGQIPPLTRRVELYLPPAAKALDTANLAMNQAVERLRATDPKTAGDRQAAALKELTQAQAALLEYWKQLLAILSKISYAAPGMAHPGGSADKEDDKARKDLMLRLLPQLIRLGQVISDLESLIAQTKAWTTTAPAASELKAVASAAKKQRAVAATANNVATEMDKLGEQAAGTAPRTVRDGVEFMNGAADALDDSNFEKANGRQEDAMEILRRAWAIVASTVASLSDVDQNNSNQPGTPPEQANAGAGGSGGISERVAGDNKPWYWQLPPRARDAIAQSKAESFPPKYEAVVKRYYERLSNRKAPK